MQTSVGCASVSSDGGFKAPSARKFLSKKFQCAKCGIESEFEAGFVKPMAIISEEEDRYHCPICWSRRKLREQKISILVVLAMGLLGSVMIWTGELVAVA